MFSNAGTLSALVVFSSLLQWSCWQVITVHMRRKWQLLAQLFQKELISTQFKTTMFLISSLTVVLKKSSLLFETFAVFGYLMLTVALYTLVAMVTSEILSSQPTAQTYQFLFIVYTIYTMYDCSPRNLIQLPSCYKIMSDIF